MKREELKNEFNKKLENIKVSDELKEKTINKIYLKGNVYRLPYWIKNCAAVLVVTCLCLSIYTVNNKNIFTKGIEDSDSSINLYNESSLSRSIKEEKLSEDSSKKSDLSNFYGIYEAKSYDSAIMEEANFNITEDLSDLDKTLKITEEEFLNNHPNAKKVENGYIIKINDTDIFYELENGLVYPKC